jgi:hypothetical protein
MTPAGMAGIINDALALILKTPPLLMPSSRASAAAIGLQRSTMMLTIRCGARPDRRTATLHKIPG